MKPITKQTVKTASKFVTIGLLIGLLIGAFIAYGQSPSSTFTISSGVHPGAPSYTIWTEGGEYFAKDANGLLAYSGTNAADSFQFVIDALGVLGGSVFIAKGTYIITHAIIPFPGALDAAGTLKITGEGIYQTILKADSNFNTLWGAYTGLIGYGKAGIGNLKVHQVIMQDLTLDGNYEGIDGGENAQPTSGGSALISLPQPFDSSASPAAPRETFHIFERVRFYRPPAYVSQGTNNAKFDKCMFDSCGQPDIDHDLLHYDIIGGGDWAFAVVMNCEYWESSGNYVDFSAGTAGRPCRLIFKNNVAFMHQIGGIYALGYYSDIEGNYLRNWEMGSGIGYDATTNESNRGWNRIMNNDFHYLSMSGWNYSDYNDMVRNNLGWATEDRGVAYFSNNASTTFIPNLSGYPTHVSVAFNSTAYGSWSWSTSATVTITVTNAGYYKMSWYAEFQP